MHFLFDAERVSHWLMVVLLIEYTGVGFVLGCRWKR